MKNHTPLTAENRLLPLLISALGLSACLLFWIEPLFGKMALPYFGGSSSVWNTCLLFFQMVLFAGYVYVFFLHRLPLRGQMGLHFILYLLSLPLLPLALPAGWVPGAETAPVLSLFLLLLSVLGLPFFLLSATAPLLQDWYHATRRPGARDPYFLYSASNAGSLGILLLYPFLLEPLLSLRTQVRLWSAGYGILIGLLGVCAWIIGRLAARSAPSVETAEPETIRPLRAIDRLHWIALSLVPSGYLYGVTRYISTDLAAVPLLWVIPLALYLLTFVIAFSNTPLARLSSWLPLQPALILPVVLSLAWPSPTLFWIVYPLHLLAFFVSALICHRQLAESRPPAGRLTEFYVWIAFGGMAGGIFSSLLAPLLFNSVMEYPILLVLACLLRPRQSSDRSLRTTLNDIFIPAAIALVLPGLVFLLESGKSVTNQVFLALLMMLTAWLCLQFRRRPVRFGFSVGALVLVGILHTSGEHNVIYQERNFYGILRVSRDETNEFHLFTHGTTTHGAQSRTPERRREPLAYFHNRSPLAQVFATLYSAPPPRHLGVVGLGIGTLACYGREGDQITFYEIDPSVERIARDPDYFTYLSDCPAAVKVVLGDARLSLSTTPDGSFDILIMDAFSSDSIPVHLVTREAIRLYFAKIKPGGTVLFQISNHYLDLEPVLAALGREMGVPVYARSLDEVTEEEVKQKKYSSDWVIMARDETVLKPLIDSGLWRRAEGGEATRVWTDDYSNLLGVIRFPHRRPMPAGVEAGDTEKPNTGGTE